MTNRLITLVLLFILSGCTPAATIIPTGTALPPTIVPSPTSTRVYSDLPVISISNASEISEISRLTKGIIEQTAWMPDGKRIVVATTAGVYIYDVSTGHQLQYFETTYAHPSISVDSSGRFLATSERTYIRIWDVESSAELYHLPDDGHTVKRVLFNPKLPIFAVEKIVQSSGEGESTEIRETQIWNAISGQLLYTLLGRHHPAFSPDGRMLGVFNNVSPDDPKVEFWNAGEGDFLFAVNGTNLFSFNPKGKSVAVQTEDRLSAEKSVEIWDTTQWNVLQTFRGEINGLASEVFNSLGCDVFNADGNLLALYDKSLDAVQFWDLTSGKIQYTIAGDICLNFSSTDYVFAANGMLWDSLTGKQIRKLGILDISIFSPDGHFLLKRGSGSGIYVVNVGTGKAVLTLDNPQGSVRTVAFSPDGKVLASGGESGDVCLWSLDTGKSINSLPGLSYIFDITFNPDGKTIAAAGVIDKNNSEEAKIELWDLKSGQSLYQWETNLANKTWMTSAAFSSDGKTLAASSVWDNAVRLWDTNTHQIRYVINDGKVSEQGNLVFTPYGRSIAIPISDKFIQFRDAINGQQTGGVYLPGDKTGGADQFAFTQDGRIFAAAGYETIWIWDMKSEKLMATLEEVGENISSIAISPDGKILALTGWTGKDDVWEIQLWNLDTMQLMIRLPKFSEWIPEIAFSPDGRLMASASADGTIRIWGIKP